MPLLLVQRRLLTWHGAEVRSGLGDSGRQLRGYARRVTMSTSTRGPALRGVRLVALFTMMAAAVLLSACGVAPWGAFASGPDAEHPAESLLEPSPIPEGPAPVPECPDSGLTFSAGVADAAMGLRVQDIVALNCGTEPFLLEGYPEVTVLDAGWQALDITVNQGSSSIESPEPAPITLAPGQTARVTLVWRNTVTTTESSEILEGVVVKIAPAAGERDQVVMPEYPIDLGNTGQIDVTAWNVP